MTGLQDDIIRADLKPHLQDPNVKDKDLLEKMTAAYTVEMERRNKLSSTGKSKTIKVATVSNEGENTLHQGCSHFFSMRATYKTTESKRSTYPIQKCKTYKYFQIY
ncbi:hypothetical protein AMECASPLE_025207 [Ameca splendens]|uniref:Uncharacterized protein n=1 Tax=Ameca splendens TaxID=208324 RepID=A0ABV0YFP3_9TELE